MPSPPCSSLLASGPSPVGCNSATAETIDLSRYREIIPYARYSSRLQASGTSEERQAQAFEAFAAEHGVTLSHRRLDRGLSGFHGDNVTAGALGGLIEDLKAARIQTPALLIVERQDRFGRQASTRTLVSLFQDLLGRGCDLYHLNQRRLYTTEILDADFGALVTLAADVHAAHQYSAILSQRSVAAHAMARDRMKAGEIVRPGWRPRWVDVMPDGWALNDYAAVVLRLVELLEAGHGQVATARILNAEGLPTPRGRTWTPGAVSHVLYSPSIAGGRPLQRRTGQVAWDHFPPVISRPRWEALLETVRQRHGNRGTPALPAGACRFIGQGITFCAACGRPWGFRSSTFITASTGRRNAMAYIRCRGRIDATCTAAALPLRPIHAHILTRLQPEALQALIGEPSRRDDADLVRRIDALRQQEAEARAMVAAGEREVAAALSAEPAVAAVIARQVAAAEAQATALQAERRSLEHQLRAQRARSGADLPGAVLRRARAMLQAFAQGQDTAEQRTELNAALRRLGLRITVDARVPAVGLAIGDAEPIWQPLNAEVADAALAQAAIGATFSAGDGWAMAAWPEGSGEASSS